MTRLYHDHSHDNTTYDSPAVAASLWFFLLLFQYWTSAPAWSIWNTFTLELLTWGSGRLKGVNKASHQMEGARGGQGLYVNWRVLFPCPSCYVSQLVYCFPIPPCKIHLSTYVNWHYLVGSEEDSTILNFNRNPFCLQLKVLLSLCSGLCSTSHHKVWFSFWVWMQFACPDAHYNGSRLSAFLLRPVRASWQAAMM